MSHVIDDGEVVSTDRSTTFFRRAAVAFVALGLTAMAPAVLAAIEPPDDPPAGSRTADTRTAAGNDAAHAACLLGDAALEKGDNGEAIAHFTEAIRFDPETPRPTPAAVSPGGGRMSRNSPSPIATRPSSSTPAWAGFMPVAARRGCPGTRVNRALADLNEAIRLDPRNAKAFSNRGGAWFKKGQLDQAIADCTEAIRLDPRMASAHGNRGVAWLKKKDLDKAIADLNEAIRLDPRDVHAISNRAAAWYEKAEPDRAIADYTEAIRLDPRNAEYRVNRATAWGMKSEYDKAIADCDEAIRLDPRNSEAYIVRGGGMEGNGTMQHGPGRSERGDSPRSP